MLANMAPGWTLGDALLERELTFKNFRVAMAFLNRLADVAEEQGHHPDIELRYNKVKLTLTTHKIGGLSRNDFVLAEKINRLLQEGTS